VPRHLALAVASVTFVARAWIVPLPQARRRAGVFPAELGPLLELATARLASAAPQTHDDILHPWNPMEAFLAFLQKNPLHMVLFAAVIITGGMLVWPLVNRVLRPRKEVSALEAVQLINRRDAVVIDVREADEYRAGHIASSRHIPTGQLAERLKELEKLKARPIIVACGTGSRTGSVMGMLQKSGFGEVYSLRGGISAWQQASMPLEK
jgi:rhodanese-related sulfurtransferase